MIKMLTKVLDKERVENSNIGKVFDINSTRFVLQKSQIGEIETFRFLRSQTAKNIRPFVGNDTSAGMEYELQVAVEGSYENVDLPISIRNSNYYKNIIKRTERGDLSSSCVEALESFLYDNSSNVWENSWVRIEKKAISEKTRLLIAHDFLCDKKNPDRGTRSDLDRFNFSHNNTEYFRFPISYVLKLALDDAMNRGENLQFQYVSTGKKLLENLVSDNTSPEILSFTIPRATEAKIGDLAAAETARTFLISQLLVQYANTTFRLAESGQKCLLYFAPHAPSRQKQLNEIVPDGFYRHLFMSPCLSGWDRGEEKHSYMGLCHKTLSRSQLNTIGKLKDAGILTNNLVILPNTSNTCLANNGIHVSLGSKVLSEMAANPAASGFTPVVEKYIGDLVIKIVEHFLPLFVGVYSAAPYRIDFRDFHPENVLGFLPHELDYTHLRMVWRRWKKKARIAFLGRALTPFGPRWFDTLLASCLGLKGDLLPDFRLVDYLVSLLSTETSPGLNGMMGNDYRLKEELMEAGVFDGRMSMYLLYRQRIQAASGYAGFEGRSYSLFHSLQEDMAEAVDMQNLITALAYKYILEEKVCHYDIPDKPSVESERRQIFFGSAIGIPTFYVRANSGNTFLNSILEHIPSIRKSNRYKGYLRVKNSDYRMALIKMIREDGNDLIESLGAEDRLLSLQNKLEGISSSACEKIVAGVSEKLPHRKKPMNVAAGVFNAAAEEYFRDDLKKNHMREGFNVLLFDCQKIEAADTKLFTQIFAGEQEPDVVDFITRKREKILSETADSETVQKFLHICLAVVHHYQQQS